MADSLACWPIFSKSTSKATGEKIYYAKQHEAFAEYSMLQQSPLVFGPKSDVSSIMGKAKEHCITSYSKEKNDMAAHMEAKTDRGSVLSILKWKQGTGIDFKATFGIDKMIEDKPP